MPLREGRQHLARGAWEEAREEFAAVLAQDPSSPEALEGLGWALFWLGDVETTFEKRESAYRIYLERGDKISAARVATGIAVDSVDLHGPAVAGGWLHRSRTLLANLETGPAHGWQSLWEGHFARSFEQDLERARAHADRALEIAVEFELRDLELLAGALEGLIKVTDGQVRDGMRQLDEAAAAAVAGEFTDLDSIATTCCLMLHACERVRDYDRAAQWGERIEALAGRWRIGSMFVACEVEYAAMLIGRGEWEDAERTLTSAFATIEVKRPLAIPATAAQLGDLRRRQGRLDEACAWFARAEGNTLAILGQASIAFDRGDRERCAELIDRLQRRRMAEKWVERAIALELLVRSRGDLDALRELREVAQKVDTATIRAHLACAEAAMAEPPIARRWLEDAVDLFEKARAPYEAARARLDLAAVLQSLGREQFAREELALAREAFAKLGVTTPAETRPASTLTKREIDVLRLVAKGLSDKEVAATLRLSEHTVHRHVANILGKLDVSSRAAAVGMAVSGHMLD
jgi:LuxR family maltose regulon positive regulatory protein